MGKILSNATATALKRILAAPPATFSAGTGLEIRRVGGHSVIGIAPDFFDQFTVTGEPPISSADYGDGPGEDLP